MCRRTLAAPKPYREAAVLLIYRHLQYSIVGFYFHTVMMFLQCIHDKQKPKDLFQMKNIFKLLQMVNDECYVLNRINIWQ